MRCELLVEAFDACHTLAKKYEFDVHDKSTKPVLAKGAAMVLEGLAIAAVEDKSTTPEARKGKLQSMTSKIETYAKMFDADIRKMMNKKVMSESMRLLLNTKGG